MYVIIYFILITHHINRLIRYEDSFLNSVLLRFKKIYKTNQILEKSTIITVGQCVSGDITFLAIFFQSMETDMHWKSKKNE